MEALGTQLAGHFHVRVWDWTLVCEDDTQPASTFSVQGNWGWFQSWSSWIATDTKPLPLLKFCCSFCSFELTVSKVILSAGRILLKTWYCLKRMASQEGTGHGDSHKLEEQGWKRRGTIPLVWMSHLSWGRLPSLERPCLDSFTRIDEDMVGHQETD